MTQINEKIEIDPWNNSTYLSQNTYILINELMKIIIFNHM